MRESKNNKAISLLIIILMLSLVNVKLSSAQGMLSFQSPSFNQLGMIPAKYTCDGENISPPFVWSNLPKNAKSLALVCLDPDAPRGFVHWVMYNIPADMGKLPENFTREKAAEKGIMFGKNSWDKMEYGGPCPPNEEHRYYFQLFVIDSKIEHMKEGFTKDKLMYAIRYNVMTKKNYIGKYAR